MSLHLSEHDLRRLSATSTTLLSPLRHERLDDWREAAVRAVEELTGAASVAFMIPGAAAESVHIYTRNMDEAAAQLWPEWTERAYQGDAVFERLVSVGAINRDMTWGESLPELRRSEYWNDYLVPLRAFDSLSLVVDATERERPGVEDLAGLSVYHDRPGAREFGERGLALFRLVLPSFRAGVAAWMRLGRFRGALAASLDRSTEALALVDAEGRVAHSNRAFARLVEGDPEAERVREAAAQLGRARVRHRATAAPGATPSRRRVATAGRAYRMAVVDFPETPGLKGPAALVTVRARGSVLPAPERLSEAFGLTPREARVALLLAEGRSNKALARSLHISPHTARRHTEKVLRKVGVSRRAAVGARVMDVRLGADAGDPPARA